MALTKSLKRTSASLTRAKTRVNSKNKKVCEKAMEFTRDKGKGPNPYCYAGSGQILCKGLKSKIESWAKNNAGESNWNHILGSDKDDNNRNWNWTMQEETTNYKAVDCSGLTKHCYADIGITLSHGSEDQKKYGINHNAEVPMSEAQPGDLIWKSGHCGIVGEDGKKAAEAQGWRWGCTYSRSITKFEKCFHLTGADDSGEDPGVDPGVDPGTQDQPLLSAPDARSAILYNKRTNQSICKQIQELVGVEPDGSFGLSTVNAIAAWQKSKNLEVDGKFGPASKKAAGFGASAPSVAPSPSPTTITTPSVTLTSSQQSSAVSYNKRNNQSICKQIQALVGVTVDGVFGPMTVNGIANWQAGKNLVADGKFGPLSKSAAGF